MFERLSIVGAARWPHTTKSDYCSLANRGAGRVPSVRAPLPRYDGNGNRIESSYDSQWLDDQKTRGDANMNEILFRTIELESYKVS